MVNVGCVKDNFDGCMHMYLLIHILKTEAGIIRMWQKSLTFLAVCPIFFIMRCLLLFFNWHVNNLSLGLGVNVSVMFYRNVNSNP